MVHRSLQRKDDETENGSGEAVGERVIDDIRRAIRNQCGAEEKIGIVLDGLRGEESIRGFIDPRMPAWRRAPRRRSGLFLGVCRNPPTLAPPYLCGFPQNGAKGDVFD